MLRELAHPAVYFRASYLITSHLYEQVRLPRVINVRTHETVGGQSHCGGLGIGKTGVKNAQSRDI